jgi:hypothetical protein
MAIKKVEIHITKFYILTWVFGLSGLFFLWRHQEIISVILFLFCYCYSVADYQTPPGSDDTGVNTDDDDIKPA